MESPIKIFSCSASTYLAEEIAKSYGVPLGKSSVLRFSDGEFQPSYEETVRGAHVFIVQSTFPPAENLMELLLMIDAAHRASAYKIIAVIPYFGFARQDRKDKPRVSIGAKLVADLLFAAGVSRIMTMDLHADQIQGFFNIPVDHMYASSVLVPYIRSLKLPNLVIGAPDIGGAKRANAYSRFLDATMVIGHKTRDKANSVGNITVIGDVVDKNVVIVDDMIDTAGTVCKAATIMKDMGVASVRVAVTHPILSGGAIERIEKSDIEEVIVTNSIPLRGYSSKIKVLSIADIFADTIKKVYNSQSISDNFIV
ncbi:MAG: ribose-phosphate pyrophosphokinase [Salinivirgaceae bacterium]|nr:ribose-phosphate pyrophosphokinase [Salinivirgaceae bacterium]MDD4746636.1 ribose-phosphate pyrophosphokinase [Salinivirgaceae bacterium]MDY0279776.1 ribose-phosphate pyrophosphokinase [Salinivirgaceae bacterium]